LGFHEATINTIKEIYTNNTTQVITPWGLTKKVQVNLGVRQGDPLSPILFNIVLDPILQKMGKIEGTTSLAFADDICIIAESRQAMENCLQIFQEESIKRNLFVNGNKSGFFVTNSAQEHPTFEVQGEQIPHLGEGSYKYLGIMINKTMDPSDQIQKLDKYINWQCNKLLPKKLPVQQKIYIAEAIIYAHVAYTACCYDIPEDTMDEWQQRITGAVLNGVAPNTTHSAKVILYLPKQESGLGMKTLKGVYQAHALRTIGRLMHTFTPATIEEEVLTHNAQAPILQNTIWQGFPQVEALQGAEVTITPNHWIPKMWEVLGEQIKGLVEFSGRFDSPTTLFGPLLTWDGPSEIGLAKLANTIHLDIAVIQELIGRELGAPPIIRCSQQQLMPVDCFSLIPEEPFSGGEKWEENIYMMGLTILNGRTLVFTDGSFRDNQGVGSVYLGPQHPYNTTIEIGKANSSTEVELIALIYAMLHIPENVRATLVTDNKANISGINQNPHWASELSWLWHYFKVHNSKRTVPVDVTHIHSHQARKLHNCSSAVKQRIDTSNSKFGAALEACISGNEAADKQAATDPPKTKYEGVVCPNSIWQLTSHGKQVPWSMKSTPAKITKRTCINHHRKIKATSKAIPKNWDKVELALCHRTDPSPEDIPQLMEPRSFLQAPENGGRHFLQLRMGSLRIKGHKGAHMRRRKFLNLPNQQQSFWDNPKCPCSEGNDSPEHRIFECPLNAEQRQKIITILGRYSDVIKQPDQLQLMWQNRENNWPTWWGLAGWWPKDPGQPLPHRKEMWQKWTAWVGKTLQDSEKRLWQMASRHQEEVRPQQHPSRVRSPPHLLPQENERPLRRQATMDRYFGPVPPDQRRRNIREREESQNQEERPPSVGGDLN